MDLLELAEKVENGKAEGCHEMFASALLSKDAQKDTKLYRRYRALMQGALKGSIDAVEKLRAELLPEYILLKCEQCFIDEDYYATFQHKHSNHKQGYGKGKTESIAKLAAILRAVHAERE